jgi:hypothetical protein
MRRLRNISAVVTLLVFGAASVPAALGVAPTKTPITFSDTTTLTGVCPFEITVESDVTLTLLEFVDTNGNVTRWLARVVEQNTFTANGKSLTSLPHTFELMALFDDSGAFTHFFEQGVLARIVLPDGSLFLTAGRVDFVPHGSPSFLFTPDAGTAGNVAGFCAALSP